jgi:hypothetical protein
MGTQADQPAIRGRGARDRRFGVGERLHVLTQRQFGNDSLSSQGVVTKIPLCEDMS